jgi:phospholipase/lecithinase/hemolysin
LILAANIMGLDVAPPAYMLTERNTWDKSGMTFAIGGSTVYHPPSNKKRVSTLRHQVDRFESLIADGTISRKHVEHSVALIAFSGNDYVTVGDDGGMNMGINDFIREVTTEIVTNVQRLQEMGIAKVLINNVPPVGCAPSQTTPNGFTRCDRGGNNYATVHNRNLKRLLKEMEDVHIIDLNSAFTNIVDGTLSIHMHATLIPINYFSLNFAYSDDKPLMCICVGDNTEVSSFFDERLAPCCQSMDPNGYCGQLGQSDTDYRYTLCDKADKYFYWDDMNPTQAGWETVMEQLQDPIKEFLGLN